MNKAHAGHSHVDHAGKPIAGIGTFMVAAGAMIELGHTGTFLLLKREDEFQKGSWEFVYGRIDQGEDLETGLRREVREETGITDLEVVTHFSTWHIYRGEQKPENEVIGVSYYCRTNQEKPKLSTEHSDYQWVSLEEASKLITVEGILADCQKLQTYRAQETSVAQYREQAGRALADYQNLVRRQQDDRQKFAKLAAMDFVTTILEPLDHLQMAAKQLNDSGLSMVVGQLLERLREQGVEMINPVGEAFDVETMEAVESKGKGKKVVAVVKPGWKLRDVVIQHAKVSVA